MPTVDIPSVGTVEFPDSMSQEDIVSAIERDILPQKVKPTPETLGTRSGAAAWGNRLDVEKGSFNEAFRPPEIVSKALDAIIPSFKPDSPEMAQLIQMAGLENTRRTAETLSEKLKGAVGSVLSPGGAVLAAAAPAAPGLVGGVTATLGAQSAWEGAKEIAKGDTVGGAFDVAMGGAMMLGGAAGMANAIPRTARALETTTGAKVSEQVSPAIPKEVIKPQDTPLSLALQAQRDAGWNTKWPFVPADLMNADFREAIRNDLSLSDVEKAQIFSAGEKLGVVPKDEAPQPVEVPARALTAEVSFPEPLSAEERAQIKADLSLELGDVSSIDEQIGQKLGGISHLVPIITRLSRIYRENGPEAGRAMLEMMAEDAPESSGFKQEVETPGFIDSLDRRIRYEVDKTKPAPPVTEQAPEIPAPTAAAVSEAEPTGVAAPSEPPAISEATPKPSTEQPIGGKEATPTAEPTTTPTPPAQVEGGGAPVKAAAKVQKQVKKVAQEEGQRSAKEVKSDLVDSIQRAIDVAPTEADVAPRSSTELHGKTTVTPDKATKITIEIPGDGTFTVRNTKEALEGLLARAKKISTDAKPKTTISAAAIKSSEKVLRASEASKGVEREKDLKEQKEKARASLYDAINTTDTEGIVGRSQPEGERWREWRIRKATPAEREEHWKGTKAEIRWVAEQRMVKFSKAAGRTENDWTFYDSAKTRADVVRGLEANLPRDAMLQDEGLKAWRDLEQEQGGYSFLAGKQPRAPGIVGMGGAVPEEFTDPTRPSELSQLTKAVETTQPVKKPFTETVKSDLTKAWEQVQDKWEAALDNLKSLGQQAMANLKGEHPWTDFKDALGKFSGANNRNDFELQQFTHAIKKAVPDDLRRQAVVNWIQADGDKALLGTRASLSKGTLKRGYELADQLTPDELVLAQNVRNYLDSKLQEGIEAGLLKEGIENYVTQLWDRPNPITNKLIGEASSGKLAPNFKYARQRIFESYFEGEQAGFKPKQKDIGFLIATYDRAFSRAIAGRELIKRLHKGTASDGRPLVEISGVSNLLSESGSPSALLIRPKARPEELAGYKPIDHPALRGWKWAGTDPETGASILYQGDMVVHPEVYTHLKNVLSSSALRQNAFFRGLLNAQITLKQSKLALSGFHFTQEGAHAAAHRVNPLAPGKIDFSDANQSALVDHGLQVADYRAYQAFTEGLSGAGSIYEKVPVVGKWLTRYNEYLFQEYIPRLKMTMAMDALERNRERFAGKLSDDQILELTANQSNAAFGELNYTMLGRNSTLQDFFRLAALAPDFLEARFRFAAQALTKTGTEQRVAILLQAATLYTAARILNQALDGDPHWDPKDAFEVFANKRRYGIRTVAEDTMHMVTDPGKFIYNRLAPVSKAAVEAVTGRDWRGINRTAVQQAEDIASWLLPITQQKTPGLSRTDTALAASGLTVRAATAQQRLMKQVADFKEAHNLVSAAEKAGMVTPSEYAPLRNALKVGTEAEIRREYEALMHPSDNTPARTPGQIRRHFVDAVRSPIGGSKKIENQFLAQADKKTQELFLEARKERQETAVKLIRLIDKWAKEKQ